MRFAKLTSSYREATRCQPVMQQHAAVENGLNSDYIGQHIRPLAVRPLDHPERVPNPWGFLFSGIGYSTFRYPVRELRP